MEVGKTLVTPFEKPINSEKSSGGKQGESHLRKLDTFNKILRKNYFKKYVEEKSHSSFKTITRTEFEKRKSSFEISSSGFRTENYKRTAKVNGFSEKETGFRFPGKARSLDDLLSSGDECEARESEMTRKLEEIHEMVQKMQHMAGGPIREKWTARKTFLPRTKSKIWGTQYPPFEANFKLKRKLIPTHFSSSFTTELGSARKSFTEKVIFQNRFVPTPSNPAGAFLDKKNVFKSTLEVLCLPETEIRLNKPFVL